jgi:hypothetical protein
MLALERDAEWGKDGVVVVKCFVHVITNQNDLHMMCHSLFRGELLPTSVVLVPAQVTIGQKIGQAMRIVSRCLWDTASDNFASEYFENESLYCVCQVYGLYYE